MGRIAKKVLSHFHHAPNGWGIKNKKRGVYLKGVRDCLEYLEKDAWHTITDDTDSYPECGAYALVEDDCGERFVAACDANCKWCVTNGESSMSLIGEVVRWIELD